ncbi:HAD family phosphatase [Pleurocapsales cyanobacterium LEGE 06147]|nr:HAD family phosphatase [Pleurocapsales cyanobacterium LEGE 06147]
MQYLALASDYDGTLATDGEVDEATLNALIRLRQSGKKLILVTGRRISSLVEIFKPIDIFDRVVAENGALLYYPKSQQSQLLCEPPSVEFVDTLKNRGVEPLSMGEAIVATWEPHEATVRKTIGEMNLPLQIIANKRAIMVLPVGINKASGVKVAMKELNLPSERVVGVGDAENDLDLLHCCGLGVAVGNALPEVKAKADWVTKGARGLGVQEAIERLF